MPAPVSNRRIEVGLVLNDQYTRGIDQAAAKTKRFKKDTEDAGKGIGGVFAKTFDYINRGVGSAITKVLSFRNALLAVGTAYGSIKLVDMVSDIENIERAFENLNKSFGLYAGSTLTALRQSTRGTLSDYRLMETANRAFLLGAAKTENQLRVLAELAIRLGRAMGVGVQKAFDDITLAVGRLSPRILDNLGIIVDVEFANIQYAKAVGKTVEELTEAEKRQSFMNATLAGAKQRLDSLGEQTETLSDIWGRFKTAIANTTQDILRALNPLFKDVFGKLTDFFLNSRDKIFDFFANMLEAAQQSMPAIISLFEYLKTAITALFTPLAKLSEIIISQKYLGVQKSIEANVTSAYLKRYEQYFKDSLEVQKASPEVRKLEEQILYLRHAGKKPGIPKYAYADVTPESITGMIAELGGGDEGLQKLLKEREQLRQALDYLQFGGPSGPELHAGPLGETAARLRALAEAERARGARGPAQEQALGAEVFAPSYTESTPRTTDALKGMLEGIEEVRKKFLDAFTQMKDAVVNLSESLVENISDGFTNALTGVETFRQAFKNMANNVIKDIIRIINRMIVMRIIGGAIQGIQGLYGYLTTPGVSEGYQGPGAGATNPYSSYGTGTNSYHSPYPAGYGATDVKLASHGGIYDRPTLISEYGQREAAVPLPDGRSIPVDLGEADSTDDRPVVININTIDAKSFDEYFAGSAARQSDMIGVMAMRQYQDNKVVRRGYS